MGYSKKQTILDVFAGAGGLSEGFANVGFDIVGHVEMDKDACETLKTRSIFHELKKTNNLEDYYSYVKGKISRENLVVKHELHHCLESVINAEIDKNSYDIILSNIKNKLGSRKLNGIIGGPPCQAYSNIGRARDKNGMVGDQRNHLYRFYLRFLSDLKPGFFVFENVPGIFTAGKGKYLEAMIKGMKDLGYIVPTPRKIDTADYNIPQSRKRVIVIGWKPNSNFDIDEIFSIPHPIDFKVKDFLNDLKPLQAGQGVAVSKYQKKSKLLSNLGIRNDESYVTDHISRPHNEQDKEIYRIAVEKLKEGEKLKYSELPKRLKTHKNQTSFLDRFKVVPGDARASQTIVAHISKDGHYYIHPDIKQNRSLSIREAARLQTFPDNYKFEGSRTTKFKQIGNAVPPLLSFYLAKKIDEQCSLLITRKVG